MNAVTRPDLPELVARYAAGEPVPELAAECGVHRATLYKWLLTGLGDDKYHDLVTNALVQRVADADQAMHTARDRDDIARAREEQKYTRMDLERRRPHLYGQKQELTVFHVDISAALADARQRAERTINPNVISSAPPAGSCIINQESETSD